MPESWWTLWRWWVLGSALLVVLGALVALWAASLATFLVSVCDNRFGFTSAPNLRCRQPMIGLVLGFGFALVGATGIAYAVGSWVARRASGGGKAPS